MSIFGSGRYVSLTTCPDRLSASISSSRICRHPRGISSSAEAIVPGRSVSARSQDTVIFCDPDDMLRPRSTISNGVRWNRSTAPSASSIGVPTNSLPDSASRKNPLSRRQSARNNPRYRKNAPAPITIPIAAASQPLRATDKMSRKENMNRKRANTAFLAIETAPPKKNERPKGIIPERIIARSPPKKSASGSVPFGRPLITSKLGSPALKRRFCQNA